MAAIMHFEWMAEKRRTKPKVNREVELRVLRNNRSILRCFRLFLPPLLYHNGTELLCSYIIFSVIDEQLRILYYRYYSYNKFNLI